jgi:hypothetical protein
MCSESLLFGVIISAQSENAPVLRDAHLVSDAFTECRLVHAECTLLWWVGIQTTWLYWNLTLLLLDINVSLKSEDIASQLP